MKTSALKKVPYFFAMSFGIGMLFLYGWYGIVRVSAEIAQQEKLSGLFSGVADARTILTYAVTGEQPADAADELEDGLEISNQNEVDATTNVGKTMATPTGAAKSTSNNATEDMRGSMTAEDRAYADAVARAIWPSGPRPADVEGAPVLYPELRPICACESSYHGTWWDAPRQYEDGEVLHNYDGNDDVGLCQINLTVNGDTAKRLGYDLNTPEGNIRYANWLFEQNGSAPWYKSEHCWREAL